MLSRYFIFIFLLLSGFKSFAQFQGLFVTYKEAFDTFSPIERLAYLYATPNFSVFEEDYKTTKKITEDVELDPAVEIIVHKPLVGENKIITTDLINNKIETFNYLYFENKSKVSDSYKLNWEFINKKQTIDKIECYKAIVNFRGRKWIAWYAPSIPYSTGPHKFHGLPGLIIKLHDETNVFK